MDYFFWKWRLNTDSFECFINILAQITVYIELWIKKSAQKYAEKGKSLYIKQHCNPEMNWQPWRALIPWLMCQ